MNGDSKAPGVSEGRLITRQPIKLPEDLRRSINKTVTRYAAFLGRPIDDDLLWAMADSVVAESGFFTKELPEAFTEALTDLVRDVLRDVVRDGYIWESAIVTGRLAVITDDATKNDWRKFAAICERVVPAIN